MKTIRQRAKEYANYTICKGNEDAFLAGASTVIEELKMVMSVSEDEHLRDNLGKTIKYLEGKTMIKEAYCSFEVAKLLKEKEFDELCKYLYNDNGERYTLASTCYQNVCDDGECLCPTHQMVLAWLREEYLLHIEIIVNPIDKGRERTDEWYYGFTIHNPRTGTTEGDSGENKYAAYEDAVEAAIRYTLEYLI